MYKKIRVGLGFAKTLTIIYFTFFNTNFAKAIEYSDWSSDASYSSRAENCLSTYGLGFNALGDVDVGTLSLLCKEAEKLAHPSHASYGYYASYTSKLGSNASIGDATAACDCQRIYQDAGSWYLHQSSCTARFPYVDFASGEACYAREYINGRYATMTSFQLLAGSRLSHMSYAALESYMSSYGYAVCSDGSQFNGYYGSWIDASGVQHSGGSLCNGCPEDYIKGNDGRCYRKPAGCANNFGIEGSKTFCDFRYASCQIGYQPDGVGGCASSLSSYNNHSSVTECDVNTDYIYSDSTRPPFNGKSAAYSSYIDENGETQEGVICFESGCPKGYAKTEDGRCRTVENSDGCLDVWANGNNVYCTNCLSGYGKTPFGDCKPCSPGCKNGCSSNDYTACKGGCKDGYTGTGCESCTGGKFYQDGECVSSCTEGYYQAGTKCVKNPNGCASYNYTTGRCNDCSGGNYLDGADCKANPEGCDSYNGTFCDVCSGGYYSDSGICKANPTGCTNYTGTYCRSCSSGYLEKDGICIPAANGCGNGYKDMGGFCNRVRWTPAEAAAVLTDDNNNSVTLTFRIIHK